ncbi:unnamed protein product [Polarella glacialis]|uniref:Fungal lipase-type domain-containing protein n=1 Tax=Polarella glacialis TaxID=89957 RepID=A0A813KJ63_POLGL|nr:unnamed protein product [Polarella glacialis]
MGVNMLFQQLKVPLRISYLALALELQSLLPALATPGAAALAAAASECESIFQARNVDFEALPPVSLALGVDDECEESDCGLNALQVLSAQHMPWRRRGVLQVHPAEESQETEASQEYGLVYALYTYGAPSTSKPAFQDLSRPSRSFRGLRCYTENILKTPGVDSRQIDFAALWMPFLHPRVPTLALRWKRNSPYWPGSGAPAEPLNVAGHYIDVGLHSQKDYVDRLARVTIKGGHGDLHTEEPFALAFKYVFMAFGAYDEQGPGYNEKTMRQQLAAHAEDFKVVAQEVLKTVEANDNIFIVQDKNSLDCVLVFEGTSSPLELQTSLKQFGTGYCGFTDVHAGYRDKLSMLMKYTMPKLRPKLAKCELVSVTGHSQGGALADIFSACANSRRVTDLDYRQQMWVKRTPESMPEVH